MNPVTDIVFSLTWVLLFAFAIRSIVKGWSMMSEDTARPNGMWTTQLKKAVHPEMEGVKPCLLYTSPSPRDLSTSRMPSSA